jgi:hypothetical protein
MVRGVISGSRVNWACGMSASRTFPLCPNTGFSKTRNEPSFHVRVSPG